MKILSKEVILKNKNSLEYPIIENGSNWKSSEKENLSILESGPEGIAFKQIIKAIDEAKEMICLQSFLIQDNQIIDALIKAKQRHVKVFILSAVEARLKPKMIKEEYRDFILEDYISLLDKKFKNNFIHRAAENFHAKYIIIDPNTNPKAFLCTNNFTNNGFLKNPEFIVELNPMQCQELFKVFVYHFWEYSTDEQTITKEFSKVKKANKFVLPILSSILLTSPNTKYNTLNKSLIQEIENTKASIALSTFQLDRNIEILNNIIKKAQQGIKVTIFTRIDESLFNTQIKDLLSLGIEVYMAPLTHAKALLIDNKTGFIFTANYMSLGLEQGLEVGIKLNEKQTKDLKTIFNKWLIDFPYKALLSIPIAELNSFYSFKDNKLQKQEITTKKIDDNSPKKINKVSELIQLFKHDEKIRNKYIKSLIINISASISPIPTDDHIKIKNNSTYDLINISNDKDKPNEVIIINDNFKIENISELEDWKDYSIYYTNK